MDLAFLLEIRFRSTQPRTVWGAHQVYSRTLGVGWLIGNDGYILQVPCEGGRLVLERFGQARTIWSWRRFNDVRVWGCGLPLDAVIDAVAQRMIDGDWPTRG